MTTIEYVPDPAMSFWPTPPEVAEDLVYSVLVPGYGDGAASRCGEVPQVRALEPSAGDGHLAAAIRQQMPACHITAVEPAGVRAAKLRDTAGLVDEVVESTLEDYLAGVAVQVLAGTFEPFELVIANPPFTLPSRPQAWAEHILAIANAPGLLTEYGAIAAVVPRNVLVGKSKPVRQVRALLGEPLALYGDGSARGRYGGVNPTERGAFDPVGAKVATALLWIHDRG